MEIFLYILTLLFVGSFFAFLSGIVANVSYDELQNINEKKNKNAEKIHKLKLNYEASQNSFFVIESLFYTAAAFFTGFQAKVLFEYTPYLLYSAIILFFFAIFLRTLLYSLGARFADSLALVFFPILKLSSYIISPFNRVLEKILGKITGNSPDDSMDELNALVETAREDGTLDAGEYRILKNIMHFSDVCASDVMTPRTVVFSCLGEMKVEDALKVSELQMYSRFPLREEASLDDGVIGYVMSKDIYYAALNGKMEAKLKDFKREIHYIPENAELDDVLDQFLKKRQHLFLVVDEYGGIDGLITMEDVLETILGAEIVDEADKFVDLRELAKQRRDKRISVPNS